MSDQTAIDRERKNAEEAVAAWHKENDARHDAEERAEKAEAEQARLRTALRDAFEAGANPAIYREQYCGKPDPKPLDDDEAFAKFMIDAALAGAPEWTAAEPTPTHTADGREILRTIEVPAHTLQVVRAVPHIRTRDEEDAGPPGSPNEAAEPAAVDPDDREGCTCAPRDQRGWRDPHCPDHGEFPLPPPPEPAGMSAEEAMREICETVRCEPDEVLETVQRLTWAQAPPVPPAAPLHVSEGTIRERLLRHADLLAERKRLWQLPPDTETAIALFREAAVALQVANPLHAALEALVEDWRPMANCGCSIHCDCDASGYEQCIADVEALLSAPAVPSSPEKQP